MALKSIEVHNTNGSDTAASGEGPGTAISGTGASTSAASAVVDLSADTPDLSGITAGMVLWVDSTSGRKFAEISSVDDGADTVTCIASHTFTNTEGSRNWGIGGQRKTLGSGTEAFGADAEPDWELRIMDAATYTLTTAFPLSRNLVGTAGDGEITPTIIGDSPTSRPTITSSTTSVDLFNISGTGSWIFENLILTHTGATRGNGVSGLNEGCQAINCRFDGCLNGWYENDSNSEICFFYSCEFENCTENGVRLRNAYGRFIGCFFHDNTTHGFYCQDNLQSEFFSCIFANNGGDGLEMTSGARDIDGLFINCVFYNNTGSGLDLTVDTVNDRVVLVVINCIFSENGAYGIDLSADKPYHSNPQVRNNFFFSNTSGNTLNLTLDASNITSSTVDPFTAKGSDDFTLNGTANGGAACKEAGIPSSWPGATGTSYPDIGVQFTQDAGGGGGGLLTHPGMTGGMRG